MVGLRSDRETVRQLLLELYGRLTTLYAGGASGDPEAEDLPAEKKRIIAEFQQQVAQEYDRRFSTDSYRWLSESEINNAVVDLFVTYSADLDLFYEMLALCGDSLFATIAQLRSRRRALRRQGTQQLRRFVESSTRCEI